MFLPEHVGQKVLSHLTRRFEFPVLLLIAGGSSAIWAFIEIAEEVREHGKENSPSYLAMLPAWRVIVDAVVGDDEANDSEDDAGG